MSKSRDRIIQTSFGKEFRMSRIVAPDGRALIVTLDHAVTLGPIVGLEDPRKTIALLNNTTADAFLMHRGLIRAGTALQLRNAGLILHSSASTNIQRASESKTQVADVEDALRLGADAFSVHVVFGAEDEPRSLSELGKVSSACLKWNIPLLVMAYLSSGAANREEISHACRVAAELGADLVKAPFPNRLDDCEYIVERCFVPVLFAGGEFDSSAGGFIAKVNAATAAGAAGVAVGRNVFQHAAPRDMLAAISKVIHGSEPRTAALNYPEERGAFS